MLTQANVLGAHPALAPLSLSLDASIATDSIQIKNISGLDPVKASVASSPQGVIDGELLTGVSIGKRNIVFTFGLNPNWATQTMTSLRQELYKYFMPNTYVTLQFISTHLPDCHIDGLVEDMIPNMFSEDPEIQVSILCARPDFIAIDETVETGIVTNTLTYDTIEYEGTRPTGFKLKIESSVANVVYTGDLLLSLNWNMVKNFQLDEITVNAAQYFELSSIAGEKYVRAVQVADSTDFESILNQVLGSEPRWPVLQYGDNELAVQASEAGQTWELSYFARFGGL